MTKKKTRQVYQMRAEYLDQVDSNKNVNNSFLFLKRSLKYV
jgi:hypothetical protein